MRRLAISPASAANRTLAASGSGAFTSRTSARARRVAGKAASAWQAGDGSIPRGFQSESLEPSAATREASGRRSGSGPNDNRDRARAGRRAGTGQSAPRPSPGQSIGHGALHILRDALRANLVCGTAVRALATTGELPPSAVERRAISAEMSGVAGGRPASAALNSMGLFGELLSLPDVAPVVA
jgi:hypothetical protein